MHILAGIPQESTLGVLFLFTFKLILKLISPAVKELLTKGFW